MVLILTPINIIFWSFFLLTDEAAQLKNYPTISQWDLTIGSNPLHFFSRPVFGCYGWNNVLCFCTVFRCVPVGQRGSTIGLSLPFFLEISECLGEERRKKNGCTPIEACISRSAAVSSTSGQGPLHSFHAFSSGRANPSRIGVGEHRPLFLRCWQPRPHAIKR